jgi:hypothetical protein
VWWTFATFGIAAISAVEFFVDREHRAEVREVGRRSKKALEPLSRSERREVGRAVRTGAAVNDPRLAPAAVAMAAHVIAGRQRPLRWVTTVIFVVWLTIPAVAAWVDRRWGLAASLTIGPVFFLSMFAVGFGLGRTATDAYEANRRLNDQLRPPTSP